MATRKLPLVAASIAALGLTTALAGSASAHRPDLSPAHPGSVSPHGTFRVAAGTTCAKQLEQDGDGVVSQNFEAAYDSLDSRGADDFTLTHTCSISAVDANGVYFNGPGPAASLHVTIYADESGAPGARVANENDLAYTDPTGMGSFTIPLTSPVTLRAGTYWVSVKANMDLVPGGEWGWATNDVPHGAAAQWQNGRNGFGTGCTTYADLATCIGLAEGTDFSFALLK